MYLSQQSSRTQTYTFPWPALFYSLNITLQWPWINQLKIPGFYDVLSKTRSYFGTRMFGFLNLLFQV
jgi:hypothetical protein